MQRLRYIGMDKHASPVYKDEETGQKWKDTDPRSHVPPSLYSTAFNAFEGHQRYLFAENSCCYQSVKRGSYYTKGGT